MSKKNFQIDELEERIAPSSLNVGSVLGGVASAANGSPTTSVGPVGDVSTGHIGSMNAVNPTLDAVQGNNLDALHGNSLGASGANIMGNSPSTGVSPNVMPNLDLDTSGGSQGGGLL
jgi:hypothetical protein